MGFKKESQSSLAKEHIVAFLSADFDKFPRLRFEYISGGTLDDYTDTSTYENGEIIIQSLSALKYLHELTPSDDLRTICGTLKYMAPEIYRKMNIPAEEQARERYTASIDLWSLGVVIAERECGLPKYQDSYSRTYNSTVVDGIGVGRNPAAFRSRDASKSKSTIKHVFETIHHFRVRNNITDRASLSPRSACFGIQGIKAESQTNITKLLR
ncbi:kinase-like domain-containing protein [Xylaria scruposa]|nr:kinase-like domain-containing protein [Xylaria scruposa]